MSQQDNAKVEDFYGTMTRRTYVIHVKSSCMIGRRSIGMMASVAGGRHIHGQRVVCSPQRRGGHWRADNAGLHTVGSSTGKAFTSASMGRDMAGLAGFIRGNPENGGLRDMDSRLVIQAGGLPVRLGGALDGGIGVVVAPSGAIDETCARAGPDAIGAE